MNPRVGELCDAIEAATTELRTIREACPHPSYTVGWWSWRVGNIQARRICDECRNCIPGITADEREKLGSLTPPSTLSWKPVIRDGSPLEAGE